MPKVTFAGPVPIETRGRSPNCRFTFGDLFVPCLRVPRVRELALGLVVVAELEVVVLAFGFAFFVAASAVVAITRVPTATRTAKNRQVTGTSLR